MSLQARRLQKSSRRTCPCGRAAVFWSALRGRLRFRADHPLCNRCWRSRLASFASTLGPLRSGIAARLPSA